MSFDSLGLSEPLLRAISAANYTTPTPIQRQAIPPIAEGRDVLGCAQTGTGKTAAFAIPLIQRLHESKIPARNKGGKGRLIKVLVLSPTRELAIQINDNFNKYAKRTKLKSVVIYGGVSQRRQTDALQRGVDVVVATPGRLLDLVNQGYVDLGYVESVVLDEADHMLDMGFLPDVRKILGLLPKKRQTLLFSATMPPDIRKLAEQNMVDPVRVTIKPDLSKAAKIKQTVYFLQGDAKPRFLLRFLKTQPKGTALVFSRTKRNADRVAERLEKAGIRAEAIHSNKTQNKRQRTLAGFRNGKVDVLVATDIAARGIDVQNITYVINYDLPDVPETYTHRIGRTGRAGQTGIAITFCESAKRKNLRMIEKHLGTRLEPGPRLPEIPDMPYTPSKDGQRAAADETRDSASDMKPGYKKTGKKPWQKPTANRRGGQSRFGKSSGSKPKSAKKPWQERADAKVRAKAKPKATPSKPKAVRLTASDSQAKPSGGPTTQPRAGKPSATEPTAKKARSKRPGKNARMRKRAEAQKKLAAATPS